MSEQPVAGHPVSPPAAAHQVPTHPVITYPPELPVSQRRDEIAAAIAAHQVVIVAGETGSGKTTQLPKICLDLGRGRSGLIGHTQPRRIAARAVAERIAEELGSELGARVGYTVRFTDRVSAGTQVRLMTDGILLAEIQRDPMLRRYDTLIVDEAHERSLNIDFLLGYLHQLLPRRPDLKLIITSATIDSARFSAHFGDAPVVEVSGRTYPVDVRYRPVIDPDDPDSDPDRDQVSAICDAVAELQREGPGDVLVFLSGEREIRDAADALRDAVTRGSLRETEVLPLYARLSAAEQHRVFASHPGRRVVLATNVAETSLTVPGIRYVVDPGTARISRYSLRTKVQRLPIEPVSQASAQQRAGRCGRVADGICIRLYTEDDFDSRPEFTDPEILRTNLASVILQMTAIGLGDLAAFPFVDPPDQRAVRDGVALLEELNAVAAGKDGAARRLTPLGRRLVRLPVDPRMARMVLEADRLGCVHEVLVIAAALSIQDPRERPVEKQQAADEAHRRYADDRSDFLAFLNLWEHLRQEQETLSSSAFRRMCRAEYLHYLRIREWQDLHSQLRRVCKDLKVTVSRTAPVGAERDAVDADRVHQALLAGLLSHVGMKNERAAAKAQQGAKAPTRGRRPLPEYLGARSISFAVFPGSALARKPPDWLVAAELVETSRLWGRTVARVEPEWVERAAAHLVKRSYAEPHWSAKRSAVVAREKVTLYGVPLVADRAVQYGSIDPELCRELFIRHALVEGDWRTQHRFFHENRRLLEDVEELEHRSRRRGILVDDEGLFTFYGKRLPAEVVSGAHFDAWWKKARRQTPDLLTFTEDDVVDDAAEQVSQHDFPHRWLVGELDLAVGYRFEPGSPEDGVTVTVPAAVMNQLPPDAFEWQVPGLRHELATALVRSLPKALRRHLAPAPDNAATMLQRLAPHTEPLLPALAREGSRLAGVAVAAADFDWDKVPAHLRVRVRVTGEQGRTVAAGKVVQDVGRAAAGTVAEAISAAAAGSGLLVEDLRSWSIPELPRTFETIGAGGPVTGYPALVDVAGRVDVQVLASVVEQQLAMRAGTRRLLLLGAAVPGAGELTQDWDTADRLALTRAPHVSLAALVRDAAGAAIDDIVVRHGGPAWDAAEFARLQGAVAAELGDLVSHDLRVVARVLASARQVEQGIKDATSMQTLTAVADVRRHLAGLVRAGFVTDAGRARLPDLQRYLRAMLRRLELLGSQPHRDAEHLWQVQQLQEEYEKVLAGLAADSVSRAAVQDVRWMLEELRVSLFAQNIGTPRPVSPQRIRKALAAATATA